LQFVAAGAKLGHQDRFYCADNGILGTDEFVDELIHRIGDFDAKAAALRRKTNRPAKRIDAECLAKAVEKVCGIAREDFGGPGKRASQMFAKEVFVLAGRQLGAKVTTLSEVIGLSVASTSRRLDSARRKAAEDKDLATSRDRAIAEYMRKGEMVKNRKK
jgi:hypothetical protein